MSTRAQKNQKNFFTLTRRNQNGQIAIFVALIFQVVFVFFALLINVGLIVHHKINLQQSTDLAAYYGAMKQAEMLNVISHVNFQVRQAWKLLAWRYRIAGSFGTISKTSGNDIGVPILIRGASAGGIAPGGPGVCNFNIAPVFCVAHSGFADWTDAGKLEETLCTTSCNELGGAQGILISNISPIAGTSVPGASTAGLINSAINQTNTNISNQCSRSSLLNEKVLSSILVSYGIDSSQRMKTLEALFKNLMNEGDKFIDLNGDPVKKGSKNTFLNNLTEANKASVGETFKSMNSLSDDSPEAAYCKAELYKKIIFNYIGLYRKKCATESGAQFGIESHNGSDAGLLTTGIEKNPWCISYYGVRAQSQPIIPFLPMSRIKLSAVSFAKPFGGSVGPRFNSMWDSATSQKVDQTLPLRAAGSAGSASAASEVMLNFSRFVGDTEGISNREYIAGYQKKMIGGYGRVLGSAGGSRPKMADWSGPGGLSANPSISPLELSAIAPNQFDVAYYSIEPDFYNNYYKNKMEANSNFKRKLEENTSMSGLMFSKDYGNDGIKAQLLQSGFNNYAAKKLQTLLTGWTFVNLTNAQGYVKFPDVNSQTTMPFAKCNDNVDAFDQTVSSPKPPTPGNCVNGGRTGYSVKIVSQDLLNGEQGPIGGEGTQGQLIRNPIPDQFLNFQ